ncbi:hypothetical protein FACS1894139_18360 [Planctomycetales bacterium]|nr:hypothetical protein FACS1894107_16400 [Planctomycetales bacterium]GHT01431.1 hypothetical protein FACS1894108_15150 [Planctomycetales bacterium]GHT08557.1 hypothetical protein FACS1894139_18360 [Planctomycetales bacterium]
MSLAAALTAPADRKMLGLLQKITPLGWAAKAITRRRYEKFARLALIGAGGAVTRATLPRLWQLANGVAEKLEIVCPEIYIADAPTVAAKIIGEEQPLLMLHRGALALDEKMMTVLLAHALTALVCGHPPYLATRDLTAAAADNLGLLKGAAALPRMLLEEWFYAAEMSGDRGALWVTDDVDLVLEFLGPPSAWGKIPASELIAQGERYLTAYRETPACPLFRTWSNLYFNLPRYGLRAAEIKKWADSAEYAQLRGDEKTATEPVYWGAFAGDLSEMELAAGGKNDLWSEMPSATDYLDLLKNEAQHFAAAAVGFAKTGAEAASMWLNPRETN